MGNNIVGGKDVIGESFPLYIIRSAVNVIKCW
jgi:hypothetical protein